MREPSLLLLEILSRRIPLAARAWQARVEEITGVALGEGLSPTMFETLPSFDRDGFLVEYTAAARWLGKAPLVLDDEDRRALEGAGVTWSIEGWRLDELGRAALLSLASARLPPAELDALVASCYRQGDSRERQALMQALPMMTGAARFVDIAVDACRTNELPIFEAIACENPYPARFFPDPSWNQMVLKALFLGVELSRVVGLEERNSEELWRMAEDYASERRAAGRPVPADIDLLTVDPADDRVTTIPG